MRSKNLLLIAGTACVIVVGAPRRADLQAQEAAEALVILEEDEPQTTYPFLARTMSEQRLSELLFDRFFYETRSQSIASRVFKDGWQVKSPHLRLSAAEDLKFSNGDPVTFSDIAFTLNRVYRNPSSGNPSSAWYAQVFGDATQSTAQSGKIEYLAEMPEAGSERYLTTTALLSQQAMDKTGQGTPDVEGTERSPIGTGPFAAAGTIENFADTTLVRNPHRLGQGDTPNPVQALRLLYNQDAARQRELMEGGRAHVWVSPPPAVIPALKAQSERYNVRRYGLNQWWYIAVDHNDEILKDPRIREALDLLIPRSQLREKLGGYADLTSGPFMPGSAWVPGDAAPTPEGRPAAEKLLGAAGWVKDAGRWVKDGEKLKLVLGVQADLNDDYYDTVYGIVDAWNDAGIEVRPRTIRDSDWRSVVESGKAAETFDLVMGRWNLDREEAVHAVFRAHEGSGPQVNIFNWSDPEIDEILKTYYRTASNPDREALMRKFHRKVHDARPSLFLWTLTVDSLYRKDQIKGFRVSPFYYFTEADGLAWKVEQ